MLCILYFDTLSFSSQQMELTWVESMQCKVIVANVRQYAGGAYLKAVTKKGHEREARITVEFYGKHLWTNNRYFENMDTWVRLNARVYFLCIFSDSEAKGRFESNSFICFDQLCQLSSLEKDDANDCVGELKHFVTGIFTSLLAPFLQAGLGIHSVWENLIQFWAIQQSASNHYASSQCFCIRNQTSVRSERVRFLTCVSIFRSIFPWLVMTEV